jgi:two-component system C4-dicarboxylate transport response regulator DctD
MKIPVYVLEDNLEMREAIATIYDRAKITDYEMFSHPDPFWKALGEGVDICILDYYLPGTTGVEILRKIKQLYPDIKVIIISGRKDVDVLIDCLNYGASNFVYKNDDRFARDLVDFTLALIKQIRERKEKGEKEIQFYNEAKKKLIPNES